MRRISLLITLIFATSAFADVRVAGVFGDHMVLQQGVKLPVWGRGEPGEAVTVRILDQSVATTTGADGKWRVELGPQKASSEPVELSIAGSSTVTIKDVLIGEVWLASGQSNMQYSLKDAHNKADALPQADRPQIRLCIVGNQPELSPLEDRKVTWQVCTPETAKGFSAVAYFFGRDLHDALKTPVGLIGSYVSGSRGEWWVPEEGFGAAPVLSHYTEALANARAELPAATQPEQLASGAPSSRYNGMIAPLAPFAIKGVIWYQGESNVKDYAEYRALFPALINGWRKQWGEEMAFLFVQLPGNNRRAEAPAASDWAMMRVAQTEALKLPKTGMAVTLDLVPKRALLHPKNKQGVGQRLALVARSVAYGEKIEGIGPTFESIQIESGKARIGFTHAAGLQMAAPPEENTAPPTTQPSSIKGFTIAGADHKFVFADAKIDGDSVIVWSDQVNEPVAVRYGWANNPEVNLYSHDLLPAAPFRTDDWPE